MVAPHTLGVARAGAEVDGGDAHFGAGLGQDAEAAEAGAAVFGIGVAHVEGAGEAGEGEVAGGGFATFGVM